MRVEKFCRREMLPAARECRVFVCNCMIIKSSRDYQLYIIQTITKKKEEEESFGLI